MAVEVSEGISTSLLDSSIDTHGRIVCEKTQRPLIAFCP
jgi:hypothetical protein